MGEFLMGFAFLFMGLDLLKNLFPTFKSNPQIPCHLSKDILLVGCSIHGSYFPFVGYHLNYYRTIFQCNCSHYINHV